MRALYVVGFAALLVAWLPVGGTALAAAQNDRPNPCVGTMAEQPDGETLVSAQGTQLTDDGYEKRPALLASFAPDGTIERVRGASANGRWWAYDVNRLSNGNLLFVTTEPGITVVGELDPRDNEYVWTERFEGDPDDESNPLITDAHDVDLIGEELVAETAADRVVELDADGTAV